MSTLSPPRRELYHHTKHANTGGQLPSPPCPCHCLSLKLGPVPNINHETVVVSRGNKSTPLLTEVLQMKNILGNMIILHRLPWTPYLIMGLHALYTSLTLHTLPWIRLDDGNHLICQFCARRVTCQSKTCELWRHFLFSNWSPRRLQRKIQLARSTYS